jgi:hypothetical protein
MTMIMMMMMTTTTNGSTSRKCSKLTCFLSFRSFVPPFFLMTKTEDRRDLYDVFGMRRTELMSRQNNRHDTSTTRDDDDMSDGEGSGGRGRRDSARDTTTTTSTATPTTPTEQRVTWSRDVLNKKGNEKDQRVGRAVAEIITDFLRDPRRTIFQRFSPFGVAVELAKGLFLAFAVTQDSTTSLRNEITSYHVDYYQVPTFVRMKKGKKKKDLLQRPPHGAAITKNFDSWSKTQRTGESSASTSSSRVTDVDDDAPEIVVVESDDDADDPDRTIRNETDDMNIDEEWQEEDNVNMNVEEDVSFVDSSDDSDGGVFMERVLANDGDEYIPDNNDDIGDLNGGPSWLRNHTSNGLEGDDFDVGESSFAANIQSSSTPGKSTTTS